MRVSGGLGLTNDTPLAFLFTWGRAMRIFDVRTRGACAVSVAASSGAAHAHVGSTEPCLTRGWGAVD